MYIISIERDNNITKDYKMETVIRFDEKTGIFFENGIYTVVGYYQSKEFKTLKGADRHAEKRALGGDDE